MLFGGFSFVGWLVRSFVGSFVRSLVFSFVRSFVGSFVRWFVRSLVGSFVRSFRAGRPHYFILGPAARTILADRSAHAREARVRAGCSLFYFRAGRPH